MPYLQYLFCPDCGYPANLDLDYLKTIESYIADGRKTTTIDDRELIWDYLVYSCNYCKKSHRYTFLDVERRVREHLSSLSEKQKIRIDDVVENQITEQARANGLYFVERSKEHYKRMKDMYSK